MTDFAPIIVISSW